jgi:hypothetical protein
VSNTDRYEPDRSNVAQQIRAHPFVGLLSEPPAAARSVVTWDDVEELTSGDVNDLGRPEPVFELAGPAEQHFVEPDRCRLADPVRVVDQRQAVVVHGVHHGVPVPAEIGCRF